MENWIVFALSAAVVFAIMQLLVRFVLDKGVRSDIALLYIVAITALVLLIYLRFTGTSLAVPTKTLWLFAVIGIIGAVANVFMYNAIRAAPNPGYALAFNALQIALVTIVAYFLFKVPFSLMKFAGMVLVVAGIVLLAL